MGHPTPAPMGQIGMEKMTVNSSVPNFISIGATGHFCRIKSVKIASQVI